ncbi:MAG: patatin [Bacteroidales bacterium]|nr:patatin [Bacteroidales bacterium]
MEKNIALVLSSGGARGYAHIGAIKVLERHGYTITSIAGTSMGAMVGGAYATGRLAAFEHWLVSLDIREVLRLTDFSISPKGFVKGIKIIEKIKEIVPECFIEDLRIPYCAVATDIIKGEESVFEEGSLYDAIRASISIPTVFQPQKIGEHYYVDGGIINPIPVNRVKRNKGDLLVVVDVNSPVPRQNRVGIPDNKEHEDHQEQINLIHSKINKLIPGKKAEELSIFNLSNKSIATMIRKISELTLEKHQPDLLINISIESFNAYDFYKAKEIIREGELATLDALNQLVTVT